MQDVLRGFGTQATTPADGFRTDPRKKLHLRTLRLAVDSAGEPWKSKAGRRRLASAAFIVVALAPVHALAQTVHFTDVKDLTAPTGVNQLVYAPRYGRLVTRNSASAIAVIDTTTGKSATERSKAQFTDIAPSPDGRYVFAADYGGENIGYGTPASQSYVHRVDLSTGVWETKKAVLAGNVEAVSGESFVLKSDDQWVTFTYNTWGTGDTITQLNTNSNSAFPGFYSGVYEGDFRYDARHGRLVHGNAGLSSQEITAFKIVGNEFVGQETSGGYGTAQGYGESVALATDGSVFYYGSLAVDALDVRHNLHSYPEVIFAATRCLAFSASKYYDAHTAAEIASLDFTASAYGLNPAGWSGLPRSLRRRVHVRWRRSFGNHVERRGSLGVRDVRRRDLPVEARRRLRLRPCKSHGSGDAVHRGGRARAARVRPPAAPLTSLSRAIADASRARPRRQEGLRAPRSRPNCSQI